MVNKSMLSTELRKKTLNMSANTVAITIVSVVVVSIHILAALLNLARSVLHVCKVSVNRHKISVA